MDYAPQPARMPAGTALLVMVIALGLGALVNIQSLRGAAERQPNGPTRTVATALVWPLERLAVVLGLDEPRRLVDASLGRGGVAGADEIAHTAGGAAIGEVPAAGSDGPLAEAIDPHDPLATQVALPAFATSVAQAGPTEQPTREYSVDDPLHIQVIGDSLTEQLGPAVIALAAQRDDLAARHDFAYSSGLTRPDFLDWSARAAQHADWADAWVVMFGANDAQDIRPSSGPFIPLGEEEWVAVYSDRVGALMDQLTADGRAVVWVGQPPMRDLEFDERMRFLNAIYAAEAAERGLVAYVDPAPLFLDEDGDYADYLPVEGGGLQLMRLQDGIHLTREGGQRLGAAVLRALAAQWDIPDDAPVSAATAD